MNGSEVRLKHGACETEVFFLSLSDLMERTRGHSVLSAEGFMAAKEPTVLQCMEQKGVEERRCSEGGRHHGCLQRVPSLSRDKPELLPSSRSCI